MQELSVEKNIVGLFLIIIPIITALILIVISWQTVPKRCYLDQRAEADLIMENLVSCSNLCWAKHNAGSDSIVDDCFVVKVFSTDRDITSQDLEGLETKRDFVKIYFGEIKIDKQYQVKVRYDGFNKEIALFGEEI